jgi:hypothetical protein
MTKEDEAVKSIVDYLEKNLSKGYKLEELKWALVNQKKSKIEIDKAIKIIEARRPKPKEEAPKIVEAAPEQPVVPEKKGFWKKLFNKN